jgi:hypothetical protein
MNPSSKIQQIQGEVDKVQLLMVNNVDKMMQRGDRLELLDSKSAVLSDGATRFQSTAHTSHRIHPRTWMTIVFCMGIIVFSVFLIIVFMKNHS